MATKQIKDPAAPPFATRDGKPITPPAGPSGARDFTATDNRRQATRPVEGQSPPSPHTTSRPQGSTIDPSQRVNMADAGRGGPGMVDADSTRARGGTAGVAHNPMKLSGAPSPRPAPAPPSSTSSASREGDLRDTTDPLPPPRRK